MDRAISSEIYMAVIDGTGDADDDKYSEEMKNSFCSQPKYLALHPLLARPLHSGKERSRR